MQNESRPSGTGRPWLQHIKKVCASFPPRVVDCINIGSGYSTIRLFSIYLWISTDRCGQPRKLLINRVQNNISRYGAETWTLRATNQKHLESSEMWCWRRMEKISWTDHVRNEEVLLRVNEQRNILHEIRKRKANWIGHILCRNCLLQQVIEGKIKGQIEVTRRRGRRRKRLLDDLK